MSDSILAAVIGLSASVVTAVGVKLVDWIKADSKLLTLTDVVEQTDKAMQAVDSWTKTCKSLEELPDGEFKTKAREIALLALGRVSKKLGVADTERTVTVAGTRVKTGVQRLLRVLRLAPPGRSYVWFPQLGFYFFVALAVTFLALPSRDFLFSGVSAALALGCWFMCAWLEAESKQGHPLLD